MAGSLHKNAPGNGRFFVSPRKHGVIILSLLTLYFGCSSSDPQIMQVDHYLAVTADDEVQEALVVSVDLFDPDGSGEIAELEVHLPDADLRWTLDVDNLAYHERDGQQWYTTAPLPIEGRQRIPRGTVAITVTDLSGREDRREVQLPRTLPELTTEAMAQLDGSGTIRPNSDAESLTVVVETAQGHREMRRVSDLSTEFSVLRVFEQGSLERLQEAEQPVRVWVLQEWGPRMQTESGPWEVDMSGLSLSDEP